MPISCQRFRSAGSRFGSSPRIGNWVCGRKTVLRGSVVMCGSGENSWGGRGTRRAASGGGRQDTSRSSVKDRAANSRREPFKDHAHGGEHKKARWARQREWRRRVVEGEEVKLYELKFVLMA